MTSRPTVRLVLAISLDGRLAFPSGGASHLGGRGDRRVLEEALTKTDAVLIGAGTLRAHRCTCLIRDPVLVQQRLDQGRSAQPHAVLVSNESAFPEDWPFFRQPLSRWLIAPIPPQSRGFDRWIPAVEGWPSRLAALHEEGVLNLTLLGGAQLAADLLQQDCVDALQLTMTPRLLGGDKTWVPTTGSYLPDCLGSPNAWSCASVEILEDQEVLLRYERRRSLS